VWDPAVCGLLSAGKTPCRALPNVIMATGFWCLKTTMSETQQEGEILCGEWVQLTCSTEF
jgi:hypothetical protein